MDVQNVKESWQNMSRKTRNIMAAIVGGTAIIAIAAILALNLGKNKDYSTLFTGLSQDEAQQVVNLLQDEGIDYRYNTSDGAIRVPASTVEQTRVDLLSKGYPKSGFAYDVYLNNSGLMSTESDKERVSVYDLQNRLGATIRVFDGVQDARVTIVMGGESRYAMGDDSGTSASASVMVTMQGGSVLTVDKAQAVKNLVSHAVPNLSFTNVAVFDSATMMEIGSEGSGSSGSLTDVTSLTSMVESNIGANVRRVLEQLYGSGNVAVSVKATLNMDRIIRETTQYTTPDKIDDEDKTGLKFTEDLTNENTSSTGQNAGGVVGADANADTPRYTNENGTEQVAEGYSNGTASREWLFNELKEQLQRDPGVLLEDASIGIVINTDNTDIPTADLMRLVANSAGISVEEVEQKVTIIRDQGPVQQATTQPQDPDVDKPGVVNKLLSLPLPILIAIGAGIVLLFLLILLLLLIRSRRKKKRALMMNADALGADAQIQPGPWPVGEDGQPEPGAFGAEDMEGGGVPGMGEPEEDEFTKNEEILNLRMQRSMRLKQNIGDFVDQNPQIAAKLIQGWLRGEEGDSSGSRNAHRGARK